MRIFQIGLLGLVLAGCAGIDVDPITSQAAKSAHGADSGLEGYVVYAPKVLLPVSATKKGCQVGPPFVVPDYDRPFRVDARSGLGQTGVEYSIQDGWMLSGVTDNSDNSALVGKLADAALPQGEKSLGEEAECPQGLYRYTRDPDQPFEKIEFPGSVPTQ